MTRSINQEQIESKAKKKGCTERAPRKARSRRIEHTAKTIGI